MLAQHTTVGVSSRECLLISGLEVKERKRKRLVSHNLSHPDENALNDLRPCVKLPLLRISSTCK